MRNNQSTLKAILLAGAASGFAVCQSAFAQTTQQGTVEPTQQRITQTQIEEIVVTARKRQEDVQKVPIQVDVATAEDLAQHQIVDLSTLSNLTPALQVVGGNGLASGTSFTIRGMGGSTVSDAFEPSVGLAIDDVPITRTELADPQFYDIANVQVLEGPQMLFGKSASAGVINMVNNDPVLDETQLVANEEFADMNTPNSGILDRTNITANVPISDDAALRASGYYAYTDGFAKNLLQPNQFTGDESAGGRAKLLWEPTSSLKVRLAGDFASDSSGATGAVFSQVQPGGTIAGLLQSAGIVPSRTNEDFAQLGPLHENAFVWGVSGKVDYDVADGYDLVDITAYRHFNSRVDQDLGGIQVDSLDVHNHSNTGQFTEELRFVSPADQRFSFQGGLFYEKLDATQAVDTSGNALNPVAGSLGAAITGPLDGALDFCSAFPAATSPLPCAFLPPASPVAPGAVPPGSNFLDALLGYPAGYLSPNTKVFDETIGFGFHQQSMSGYFEGIYKLTDSLRLDAGLRYTYDRLSFTDMNTPHNDGLVVLETPGSFADKLDKFNVSYRASVDYDVTSSTMAYFTYAVGYKEPTFETLPLCNGPSPFTTSIPCPVGQPLAILPVGDEIPKDYELGVKSTVLDNRLRLNANLFNETFYGYQEQIAEVTGGVEHAFITSGGTLKTKGFELQATALPIDGLSINGALLYDSTNYQNMPILQCYPGEPFGAGPKMCSAPVYLVGNTSVDGNQLRQAPLWSGNVTVRYEQPIWDGWNGFIQGDAYLRSSFNFQAYADPDTLEKSAGIFGLSFGTYSDDGHWTASFFVRNLFDNRVPASLSTGVLGALSGDVVKCDCNIGYDQNSFRTIGVSLGYRM